MFDLFIPDVSKEFEIYSKGCCLNSRGFKGGFIHNYLIDEINKGSLLPVFNHDRRNNTLSFTALSPEGVNLNYFGVYLGDVLENVPESLYRENLLVSLPRNISNGFLDNLEKTLNEVGGRLIYTQKDSEMFSDKIFKTKKARERLKQKGF